MQGNLADALWQVPDGRADAVARYQRASLLAEKQLEATPGDPMLRAQLGFFYGRIGDGERSRRYLSEALGAGPELLYVQYFAGVAAADREDRPAALRAVVELVRLGYPPSLLRTAPEFRGLLQDAEYRKIIGARLKVNHAMSDDAGLSRFERLLSLVTRMRPGEGRAAFLFFLHGFLLLSSYQVVKALREAFMLTRFSAETRSYAVAVMALVLMFVVPLYGWVRRHLDGAQLLRAVTLFFVLTMPLFALLADAGVSIAFVFFIWVGIYGVMVVSQMWAFAADSFNVKSGQRLFVVIMLGANLGALAGAKLAHLAAAALSPVGLIVLAAGLLGATLFLAGPERAAVPEGSRALLGRARQARAAAAGRHRPRIARPLPAADRAAGRAAQLDQLDRRIHPGRFRQARRRGARRSRRGHARRSAR